VGGKACQVRVAYYGHLKITGVFLISFGHVKDRMLSRKQNKNNAA
jgi:hypothetical protein